ncbi:MAG: Hpt domain-containing protein [Firmicutes bacterium]|nr:Hpt domain-containing protein [Bacillota bacterium]
MLTVDALKQFGADTADGLGRCLNNEAFYLKLVGRVPGDKNFDKLSESIAQGDKKSAFEAAHALKGIMANLGITPLYEPISSLTELLRDELDADYPALLEKILKLRDELSAMCG